VKGTGQIRERFSVQIQVTLQVNAIESRRWIWLVIAIVGDRVGTDARGIGLRKDLRESPNCQDE
jgi:hypothetical protein